MAGLKTSQILVYDENKIFRFIFKQLPQAPLYKKFAADFKSADMLIISDFKWGVIHDKILSLVGLARKGGMKTYALHIGNTDYLEEPELGELESEKPFFLGSDFYLDCDYRYVYDGGRCFMYNPWDDEV